MIGYFKINTYGVHQLLYLSISLAKFNFKLLCFDVIIDINCLLLGLILNGGGGLPVVACNLSFKLLYSESPWFLYLVKIDDLQWLFNSFNILN